ncbi:hypothetical protein [Streptomyces aureocirculatus]|uniref:hypothetical protein n=1 Tax=Streptomyces aureocirculatus TaxID=67275 RepID=UPI0004CC4F94|nr:hypothetical protein [Streptomyces aureocirculatus]
MCPTSGVKARSRGIVGLLRRLIEAGCTGAIASGEERLSLELLRSTPIRLGNLDDLDAETGEVPDIPQNVPPPAASAKKSATRPRNTVFDDRGERPAADG